MTNFLVTPETPITNLYCKLQTITLEPNELKMIATVGFFPSEVATVPLSVRHYVVNNLSETIVGELLNQVISSINQNDEGFTAALLS
jgi:hypothetical protein